MKSFRKAFRKGFTLIELLIVIAILGILATAVLSAINPVEQINRGRDTGTQSDAEQLLSAISRFNASQGYFPWLTGANDTTNASPALHTGWTIVNTTAGTKGTVWGTNGWTVDDAGTTQVLYVLGSDTTKYAAASNELQNSYITKISAKPYNYLYVYNRGTAGDSTYVCFKPQSGSFMTTAKNRCGVNGAGLPSDIDSTPKTTICDDTNKIYYICLP